MQEDAKRFGATIGHPPARAALDVIAERLRQIFGEGFDVANDDTHRDGEMARAAACYALHAGGRGGLPLWLWPWSATWWKPTSPRRDLEKAGALILAEIERIDRAATVSAPAMEPF